MPLLSRVRCYECGRRTDPELSCCSHCGAVLFSLCECEAHLSVYDDHCDACGREQTPRKYVTRFRRLRVLIIMVVVLLACVAAWRLVPRDAATMKRRTFDSAVADFEAGRYEVAQLKLERYIADYGETARALYMLGASLFRLGRTDEAKEKARRALETEPYFDEAALFLGTLAFAEGEYDLALEYGRTALSAPPRPPAAHVLLGKVFTRAEHLNVGGAIHQLEAALDAGSEDPEALVLLAELMLRTRRVMPSRYFAADASRHIDRARNIAKDILEANRNDPLVLHFLARCDYATGDLESAYVLLRKAQQREDLPERMRLLLARIEWRQDNRAEARRLLDELVAGGPDVALLLEIADFFHEEGRDDLSSEVLATAREKYGQNAGVVLRTAASLVRAGRREEALAAVDHAIARDPGDFRLVATRADVLRASGRSAEAERDLRHALEGAPDDDLLRLSMADLLLDVPVSRVRVAEASDLLGSIEAPAWKGSPYSFFLSFLRAKLLLRQKRHGEALVALRDVEAQLPDHFGTRLLLSEVHRLLGERDLEILELDAAIRIRGGLPALYAARAEARLARDLIEGAEQDARDALEADPTHEAARIALARALAERPRPRYEEAEEILRQAMAEPGASIRPRIALGKILAAQGRTGDGERELLAAVREAPSDDLGLVAAATLADVRLRTPSGPTVRVWREYLDAHPDSVGGRLLYASTLLDQGSVDAARPLLEQALALEPDSVRARRFLFDAALPDGAEASRIADEVHRLAPDGPEDLYLRGRIALERGEPEEAAKLLELAFDRAPTDARIAQFLGFALHLAKDHDRAAAVLERAVVLEPGLLSARSLLARARFERGRALLDSGHALDAAESLESALQLESDLLPAQALLALASFRTGTEGDPAALVRAWDECTALITRLLAKGDALTPEERQGVLLPAYLLLADIARQRGDAPGLVRALEGHHRLAPEDPAATLGLAAAYLQSGDPAKAESLLSATSEESPLRFHVLARAREDLGDREGALTALREWAEKLPEDAVAREAIGRLLVRMDRREDAEGELRAALSLDADRIGAAEVLLNLLLEDRGAAAAIAAVEPYLERTSRGPELKSLLVGAALEGDPDTPGAVEDLEIALKGEFRSHRYRIKATIVLLRLCVREGNMGKGARAAAEFVRFADTAPGLSRGAPLAGPAAEAFFLCGLVHHIAKDVEAAEHGYQKAIHLDPANLGAMNNLAELLLDTVDRTADALPVAERAAEIARDRPEVHDTLGKARLASGDPQGALRSFNRAIRIYGELIADPPASWDPRALSGLLADALVGRSLARIASDDRKGAREDLDRALELAPKIGTDPRYRDALSRAAE